MVWGLQPVLTRWLQVRSGVDAMSLVFIALLTSFGANMLSSAYTSAFGRNAEPPLPTPAPTPTASTSASASTWSYAHKRMAVLIAMCYSARSSTNFFSASLTHAYTVAMIQMLGVFVMASFQVVVTPHEVSNRVLGGAAGTRAPPRLF